MYILNLNLLAFVEANTSDSRTQMVAALFCIFLIVFIVMFVSVFLISKNEVRRAKVNRLGSYSSQRIYIINFKDQVVDYFDSNGLKKIETIGFIDFLNFFSEAQQNNVRTYIMQLINLDFDPYSEESILVSDIGINSGKKKIFYRCLFQCESVDKIKQLVYLKSTRLLHTPLITKRSGKKVGRQDIYQLGVIKKMYDEGRFNKGSIHLFKIILKPNTLNYVNHFALRRLIINYIYSVLNNVNDYFYFSGDSLEFSVIDVRQMNEYQTAKLQFEMLKQVKKFFEIYGLSNVFEATLVSGKISDLPFYYDDAYKVLLDLYKSSTVSNNKIVLYKSEKNDEEVVGKTYKNEIERIIKDKLYSIEFCPIVHISNKKVLVSGYMSYVEYRSSIFSKDKDIFKYTHDFNMSNELISGIIRKGVPTFLSQKENATQKLTILVSIHDLDNAKKAISHISGSNNSKIIFMINSKELIDIEDDDFYSRQIAQFKENGFEFGVYMSVGDYFLKSKTYLQFDYYYVNTKIENNAKQDSRSFINAHSLLDKLVKFNRPIIVIGLTSMQSVELLYNSGINIFCCDAISKRNVMLLPLDKKQEKKLLEMKRK